jgi:hypothetical protein
VNAIDNLATTALTHGWDITYTVSGGLKLNRDDQTIRVSASVRGSVTAATVNGDKLTGREKAYRLVSLVTALRTAQPTAAPAQPAKAPSKLTRAQRDALTATSRVFMGNARHVLASSAANPRTLASLARLGLVTDGTRTALWALTEEGFRVASALPGMNPAWWLAEAAWVRGDAAPAAAPVEPPVQQLSASMRATLAALHSAERAHREYDLPGYVLCALAKRGLAAGNRWAGFRTTAEGRRVLGVPESDALSCQRD